MFAKLQQKGGKSVGLYDIQEGQGSRINVSKRQGVIVEFNPCRTLELDACVGDRCTDCVCLSGVIVVCIVLLILRPYSALAEKEFVWYKCLHFGTGILCSVGRDSGRDVFTLKPSLNSMYRQVKHLSEVKYINGYY